MERPVIGRREIQIVAEFLLRYSLVLVVAWSGGIKRTALVAAGIQPLVSSIPFFTWMYRFLTIQAVPNIFGVAEIGIATMVAGRPWAPKVSAGNGLAVVVFLGLKTCLEPQRRISPLL